MTASINSVAKIAKNMIQRPTITGLHGVIFNLTGTLVDHGGYAPTTAVSAGFAAYGVHVPDHIIRKHSGLPMHFQINHICKYPEYVKQWDNINDRGFKKSDIDMITDRTNRALAITVKEYGQLIPGAKELIGILRDAGIKVGISSEYDREITDSILANTEARDMLPVDTVVYGDQSANDILDTWCRVIDDNQRHKFLKIGSTDRDVWDGVCSGIYTCNVIDSSQLMGISYAHRQTVVREYYNYKTTELMQRWQAINCDYFAQSVEQIAMVLTPLKITGANNRGK